jgi:hypothetical protein
MMSSTDEQLLYAKLNGETARIPWRELQRYFASGLVIQVNEELDLVDVAARVAKDDTATVSQWMDENRLGKVADEQAQAWLEADTQVWAVVVRPWILVQHRIVH